MPHLPHGLPALVSAVIQALIFRLKSAMQHCSCQGFEGGLKPLVFSFSFVSVAHVFVWPLLSSLHVFTNRLFRLSLKSAIGMLGHFELFSEYLTAVCKTFWASPGTGNDCNKRLRTTPRPNGLGLCRPIGDNQTRDVLRCHKGAREKHKRATLLESVSLRTPHSRSQRNNPTIMASQSSAWAI